MGNRFQQTLTRPLARLLGLAAAGWLFAAPSIAQALDNRGESGREICEQAARHMEHVERIPAHLLEAISLTETGRWDKADQANFAWPWTVTAEGKGRYLPSKAAAIAEVRKLKMRGIKNIDVGCMQVNLYYHPNAFADLEQAFDPTINIAYAAGFLKRQYAKTGSWSNAAAAYHSLTPKYNRKYKAKVLGLWQKTRKNAVKRLFAQAAQVHEPVEEEDVAEREATPAPATTGATPGVDKMEIDHQRTARLNQSLRTRRLLSQTGGTTHKRHLQLDTWRSKEFADNGNHVAVMRRARLDTQRRQQRQGSTRTENGFAAKRRLQLDAWRANLPNS